MAWMLSLFKKCLYLAQIHRVHNFMLRDVSYQLFCITIGWTTDPNNCCCCPVCVQCHSLNILVYIL